MGQDRGKKNKKKKTTQTAQKPESNECIRAGRIRICACVHE